MAANNGALMTPTLIVTRPAPQGQAFADAVKARWYDPLDIILSPLLRIVPLPLKKDLSGMKGVIFTSINGVAAAVEAKLSRDVAAWCVGEKTGEAARDAGFVPIIGPGDAEGLAKMIIARKPDGPLAHIRGQHSRGDMAGRLQRAGLRCDDIVGYDQEPLPFTPSAIAALEVQKQVIFPLFSPRTATILKASGPFVASVDVVAISAAVERAIAGLGARCVVVADRPDMSAMVDATIGCLNALNGRAI